MHNNQLTSLQSEIEYVENMRLMHLQVDKQ